MPNVNLPEILLILFIVLLLFGVGRIGKIAGELGSGIRAFRQGLKGDDETNKEEAQPTESDNNQK